MSIAGMAAERATSEQITLMSEEIAGMYASLSEPEQYLVHDMRFHQTIAAASNNRILTSLMNMPMRIGAACHTCATTPQACSAHGAINAADSMASTGAV